MPATLVLAPAAHGKTEHVLRRIAAVRAGSRLSPVIVILPGRNQVDAFRSRLAAHGDVLAIHLLTFYELYAELLAQEGRLLPRLDGAAQSHLIRRLIDELTSQGRLPYFAPVCGKPGFPATVRESLEELKRARLLPDMFEVAVRGSPQSAGQGLGPRLEELATLYSAYQRWLLDNNWADSEGLGWLSAIALDQNPRLGCDWRLLVVDGFDEFNPTQLAVLGHLSRRAEETVITLTGEVHRRRLAHRRFQRAAAQLTAALPPLASEILTGMAPISAELRFLEQNLFEPGVTFSGAPAQITFLEAQNRAVEARAALRWLKQRFVDDHLPPSEVAVLARSLEPYRPFIEETAREFGLPLRMVGGVPLLANPVISALFGLLALPAAGSAWRPRDLLAALRSPYFDWRGAGIDASQAANLDAFSRQAKVVGGLEQWRAALNWPAATDASLVADEPEAGLTFPAHSAGAPASAALEAIVARLTPPAKSPLAGYLAFVENLIGDDPTLPASSLSDGPQTPGSLKVVERALAGQATAERDLAALRTFKDVLRGLALSASIVAATASEWDYAGFLGALRQGVAATNYQPEALPAEGLFVASILDARGLSFRAVALLGLAEGEFPQAEREMPLLRESDRAALRARRAPIEPHLHGDEITIFYEAITRARQHLLVSRPYLADDGQVWEPSTYWRQVWRLMGQPKPLVARPEARLEREAVASYAEWVEQGYDPGAIARGAAVLQARQAATATGPFEGELPELAALLALRYPSSQSWSASRLEAYGTCGFYFYVAHGLDLEPRVEPEAGYDARVLGSMYHAILQRLYTLAGDPGDAQALRGQLPGIAQSVFATAPTIYGFRPTALWAQQQTELLRILQDTVAALAEISEGWTPRYFEQRFGFGAAPLVVGTPNGPVRLHGIIDRIDVNAAGQLRLIDYKASGAAIAAADLQDGHRLQLPLYALGARDALQLGEVAEGFYWHIGQARASSLKLSKFEGGVAGALEAANGHLAAHVAGILAGDFQPRPPENGCPNYCPAIGLCWRYARRRY